MPEPIIEGMDGVPVDLDAEPAKLSFVDRCFGKALELLVHGLNGGEAQRL